MNLSIIFFYFIPVLLLPYADYILVAVRIKLYYNRNKIEIKINALNLRKKMKNF